MKQYSKDELQPLLDHIQETAEAGSTVIALNIKDVLLMAEHIQDAETVLEILERLSRGKQSE